MFRRSVNCPGHGNDGASLHLWKRPWLSNDVPAKGALRVSSLLNFSCVERNWVQSRS